MAAVHPLPPYEASLPPPDLDARWVASGLRKRVLLPLAAVLVLMVALLAGMIVYSGIEHRDEETENTAEHIQTLIREHGWRDVRSMRTMAELLAADDALVQAFRRRDRAGLVALGSPLVRGMTVRNRISQLTFILPDRRVLLRAHAPQQHGDVLQRQSLLEAERTGRPAWYPEQNVLGAVALRLVHPVREHGELVGWLELGVAFEELGAEIKRATGIDVFLAVDKAGLDEARYRDAPWQRAQQDWNEFPQVVVSMRTTVALPAPLREFFAQPYAALGGRNFSIDDEGLHLQVTSQPLLHEGKELGKLVIVRDQAFHWREENEAIVRLLVTTAIVGGALMLFFHSLLGRVQREVGERSDRLHEVRETLAAERQERQRAERDLADQQERNELLEARSRMVEELGAANRTAQRALRENEEITRKLRETQGELVATARQAGRAEIATNVLHNVGNVLNSVTTSAGVVGTTLRKSRVDGLLRAVAMLETHEGDLGQFLASDEKGKLLPAYLKTAAGVVAADHRRMGEEIARLVKNVEHIKDIVSTQQSHARAGQVLEPVAPTSLAEDALRMQETALVRHQLTVLREFDPTPMVPLDRARVLQILVNLISNAKAAISARPDGTRTITLRVGLADADHLRFEVSDTGEGIPAENLTRIFNHGFTTRQDGHGFGLHSCALAARELGGELTAHSDGPGQGATFTLLLPLQPPRRD